LPFAIVGAVYAFTQNAIPFNIILFFQIVLCMVFARTAAMAFNRLIDAKIDAQNSRTEKREIPSGIISEANVLLLVILSCSFFILTTWFINKTVFLLSPIALGVVLGYSYTKRFTRFSHVFLGLGLALGPMGAYLSVTPQFDLAMFYISLCVLFWVAGFDIIYALQDYDFDRTHNLFSIPVKYGKSKALNISAVFHSICILLLIATGIKIDAGAFFYIGVCFFSWKLLHQHKLVTVNDLSKINRAFFTSNGYASIIFCLLFLMDLVFGI